MPTSYDSLTTYIYNQSWWRKGLFVFKRKRLHKYRLPVVTQVAVSSPAVEQAKVAFDFFLPEAQKCDLALSVADKALNLRIPSPSMVGKRYRAAVANPLQTLRLFDEKQTDTEQFGGGMAQGAVAFANPFEEFYDLLLPPPSVAIPAPEYDKLYDFQKTGVDFLVTKTHALLADDPGLGKTLQTLYALRYLIAQGKVQRALVICTVSARRLVWAVEAHRWCPMMHVTLLSDEPDRRKRQWRSPSSHLFIASYGTVRKDMNNGSSLAEQQFDLVILDEAHRIKNRATQTFGAVVKIKRRYSWALTATPLETKSEDVVNIFDFIDPAVFGGSTRSTPLSPQQVHTRIEPYMLRRRKTDDGIWQLFPEKEHFSAPLQLTGEQLEAYKKAESDIQRYVNETRARLKLGRQGAHQIRISILGKIQTFKQLCNYEPVSGQSAKLAWLVPRLGRLFDEGRKVLLFTQYVETLRFLEGQLLQFHPITFYGELSEAGRFRRVERFKKTNGSCLMLISLMAGGESLNLQGASYVIHFDRWWNPARETQAEDRAHRLNSKTESKIDKVTVVRMIAKNTIEEKIDKMLAQRRELFNVVIDDEEGDPAPGQLLIKEGWGLDDLLSLFD